MSIAHGLPGKIIVLEGSDGCGKGTQIEWLYRALSAREDMPEVIKTFEPWNVPESPVGMRIRRILKHQEMEIDPGDGTIDNKKLQKLYVADRFLHWSVLILEQLALGRIVICDRERLSTYAYGYAFGLDVTEIQVWHQLLPTPDVIILLDVPADICAGRIAKRSLELDEKAEYFESEKKISKIVPAYHHIHSLGILPTVIVDGTGPPAVVHQNVLRIIPPIIGGG